MIRGFYNTLFLSLTAVILSFLLCVDGYRVLLIYPFITPSVGFLGDAYARELLRKGHEVTYITSYPKDNKPNLTQIDVSSILDNLASDYLTISKLLDDDHDMNDLGDLMELADAILTSVVTHERVKDLIKDPEQHFDVVIAVWYNNELYAGFSALYQCPLVWSTTMEVDSLLLRVVDEVQNPAYTTDPFSYQPHSFSFLQRVNELWQLLRKLYLMELSISKTEQMYSEVFVSAARKRGLTLPPYRELIYNASLVLTNAHPSLHEATKYPQNVKGIAGYHIDTAIKPLPLALQQIMDDANDGVIYFSLGSYMKSKYLPEQMKTGLLKMFSGLPQTVLWKFEEELPNLPGNVHILKWAPQPSILAHPNTKLFITHGGLLSTTETVHFGVPIVGIPLFVDQFQNMERAVQRGFGLRVKFSWNLANDLGNAVEAVLTNSSYTACVRQLSALYHDRPLAPADELVYWVEHAARTRGAPHLRSAALLLPWYRRLYVDLLALLVTALLGTVLLVSKLLGLCPRRSMNVKMKSN